MTRPIRTKDLDVAAAIMTATGIQPVIAHDNGDALSTFELPGDEITINLLSRYAAGDLSLNVKRFASCRNLLFKKLREAKQ